MEVAISVSICGGSAPARCISRRGNCYDNSLVGCRIKCKKIEIDATGYRQWRGTDYLRERDAVRCSLFSLSMIVPRCPYIPLLTVFAIAAQLTTNVKQIHLASIVAFRQLHA